MNTIEPGILKVGCWDLYFRLDQHSLTKLREPQPSFVWIDNSDDPAIVDVALATQNSHGILLGSKHPRKVIYLQETSEYHGNRNINVYRQFDLVLTNDQALLDSPELARKVRYQTLFGTWLTQTEVSPKTKLCSMLAGKNNFLSGHRIRHAVAKAARPGGPLHGLLDVYGTIDGGNHVPTEIAYDEYFFNLAVCNSQYNFWATEKVFNPMAAKTVPIYWGSPSLEPLRPYGFTDLGLIRWDGSVESLEKILRELQNDPEKVYTEKYEAIQQNYEATHRWWCHELTLESVLRDFFGFPVNEDLPKMLT